MSEVAIGGPPVEDEGDQLSIEENRRILGVQIAAGLVSQNGEGVEELLTYADQIEKFLESGLQTGPVGETSEA